MCGSPTSVNPAASRHTLLVASTGGHLEELVRLAPRFSPRALRVSWVTHQHPQVDTLLAGEDVHFVADIPPRGYGPLIAAIPKAVRHLRRDDVDRVVSTGAGVALPYFVASVATGTPFHYIESAARLQGPSLTGRVAAKLPRRALYAQYESWSDDRWQYQGSVFDDFQVGPVRVPRPVRRVVVTVGTMRTYGFERLIDRLQRILPDVLESDGEIWWQTGASRVSSLPGTWREWTSRRELEEAMSSADLVVTHAGVGSALMALTVGLRPVLVPRRVEFAEHVDDHQAMIAKELSTRNLAVQAEADTLTADDLLQAAWSSVGRTPNPAHFLLGGG